MTFVPGDLMMAPAARLVAWGSACAVPGLALLAFGFWLPASALLAGAALLFVGAVRARRTGEYPLIEETTQ